MSTRQQPMHCKVDNDTASLIEEMYADSIVLTAIGKEQVKALDARWLIGFVDSLPESATVAVKFAGYENDPREVWEIFEIRGFVQMTLTEAPWILSRFVPECRRMMRGCVLDSPKERLPDGRVIYKLTPLWVWITEVAGINPAE